MPGLPEEPPERRGQEHQVGSQAKQHLFLEGPSTGFLGSVQESVQRLCQNSLSGNGMNPGSVSGRHGPRFSFQRGFFFSAVGKEVKEGASASEKSCCIRPSNVV
jgi:hypothetical protein